MTQMKWYRCACRPTSISDLTSKILPVLISYDTLSLVSITCANYGTSLSTFVPAYNTDTLVCYFQQNVGVPSCSTSSSPLYRRFCPCSAGEPHFYFHPFFNLHLLAFLLPQNFENHGYLLVKYRYNYL